MARPRTHDEALRTRLLDRAGELLSTEGAKALSLRKLATDVGTSTTAVYSLFGSKPDLVNALYAEGFQRFGARMEAVGHTDDPVEDFVRLGLAYRDSALADPHLYSIMFTKAVPGFEPSAEATELSQGTLAPLVETVRRAIETGRFRDTDPKAIAVSAWGIVHGLVSLELSGNLPLNLDVTGSYEAALRAHARGWCR
ncbi:MAG TPA: TetR/AcrR family transcriptional regulator [Amycolatopsis sp.]|nr:TetR/AcrR family transcriptional regulator [Amycolatopsis sp.]